MKLIQVILLLALVATLISYFRWFRNAALDKMLIAVIVLAGMGFVLFPDTTTRVAVFLGVGRGADLLFYMAIVVFGYLILMLYSKIKKLENQLADLLRQQALHEAKDSLQTTSKQ